MGFSIGILNKYLGFGDTDRAIVLREMGNGIGILNKYSGRIGLRMWLMMRLGGLGFIDYIV